MKTLITIPRETSRVLCHYLTEIVLVLLGLLSTVSYSAVEPGPGYELVSQDKPANEFEFFGAPHIDIVKELYRRTDHRVNGDSPAFKIVLSSLADPSKKELLFAYDREAVADLSPDGKWFIVNDRPIRGQCDPRLFKQQKGLQFTEIEDAAIRKKAIHFFVRYNKYPPDILKHMIGEGDCIVESMLWGDDSNSLLLRISKGRTGEPIWIWDWHCVYDLKSGKISTDLRALNREAILPGKYLTTHH